MNRLITSLGLALGLVSTAVFLGSSSGGANEVATGEFDVTITNLTRGQIFAPILVTTHDLGVRLFEAGSPASPELATLAEEGNTAPLAALLMGTPGVADVAIGSGMVPPGASETIRVSNFGIAHRLSLAGMLVTTNDTFAAIDAIALPRGLGVETHAVAYDAGSEFNSESCAYVPGPPCGSGGMHDPTTPEGFVHVSSGIQGHGDIDPVNYDWRNPVARVVIRRVN